MIMDISRCPPHNTRLNIQDGDGYDGGGTYIKKSAVKRFLVTSNIRNYFVRRT